MVINSREIALNILVNINEEEAFSNLAIQNHLPEGISKLDENLIREIVYGVLENKAYLDYIISKASKIKLKKIHPKIKELLRMGIYQIYFMDRIPESAAVNESVKLAKKYGNKGSIGFVNGVLRSIARNKEGFGRIDSKDKVKYLSLKYSHPEFLVRRWIGDFGLDFTEALLIANNQSPKLNIRVNTLKIEKEKLKDLLEDKGYVVHPGQYAKDCLIIDNPNKITELGEFKDGYFIIQDESSQLVAQIMNPMEGAFVLDVCSAPGGKTTHLAQIMNNKGKIKARDIFDHKLNLVEENARRLGIDIIETECFDALKRDENLINKADYLLIDAPCTGFGLLRRKPDIKWNRKEEDIKELSELQFKILETSKDYLKPGGILLYSTCTIEKDENINLINRFLDKYKEYKLVPIDTEIENKGNLTTLDRGFIQLFPHKNQTDGFFIAKMVKEG